MLENNRSSQQVVIYPSGLEFKNVPKQTSENQTLGN